MKPEDRFEVVNDAIGNNGWGVRDNLTKNTLPVNDKSKATAIRMRNKLIKFYKEKP